MGGCALTTAQPIADRTAFASLAVAIVGAIAWPVVGGWASLLAGTISIALGFAGLSRIRRNKRTGRWAAIVGIGFGVVIYAVLIGYVVRDLVDPVVLQP